jgi:hypothetical protein
MSAPDTADLIERLEAAGKYDWPITHHGVADADDVERALCRLSADDAALAYRIQGAITALLSAAREGEKLREALLIARRYVADLPIAGDADLAKIDAALQSETPHDRP